MRLSTKGRYAVMAMADLAGNATNTQSPGEPRPVALADIAERQDISLSYLEQLFAKLRRGGLVTSVRGPGGGYRLSRPSGELRIADIIWRWTSPLPPPAARPAAPRVAPRRARAASPMICGKNSASKFTSSCRRYRWPMWWNDGFWAASKPCNDLNAVLGGETRGGLSRAKPCIIWITMPLRRCARNPSPRLTACAGDRRQPVFSPCQRPRRARRHGRCARDSGGAGRRQSRMR